MKKLSAVFIASLSAVLIFQFLLWTLYKFVMGANLNAARAFYSLLIIILVFVLSIIISVKICRLVNIKFTPAMLFATAFLPWLIFSALSPLGKDSTIDLHYRDTYYVIGVTRAMIFTSACFGIISGIYYLFPKMFGRNINNAPAIIHFWITFVGVYTLFIFMCLTGPGVLPHRYVEYAGLSENNRFDILSKFILVVAITVVAVQVVFVWNVLYRIYRRENKNAVL